MAKGRPAKIGPKVDDRPQRALAVPKSDDSIVAIPPMPLSLPDGAAETWAIVCRSLPGLVASDLADVEICVSAFYRYRQLDQQINDLGYVQWVALTDDEGSPLTDPETGEPVKVAQVPPAIVRLDKMRQAAANQYRYHADQLGLSRMARARLNLLDLAGRNELASLTERVKAFGKATK